MRRADEPCPVPDHPRLLTRRLVLRPFAPEDAVELAARAGRREIADTTISIPHPYSEAQAREWIAARADRSGLAREVALAIIGKNRGEMIGGVGLREINLQHSHAELGCWISVDYWRQGYASEATAVLLQFAFEQMRLNRVYAHHMVRNPASGRVLEKVGLKREGLLRQCVRKWGAFEDVVLLAILRSEWEAESRG